MWLSSSDRLGGRSRIVAVIVAAQLFLTVFVLGGSGESAGLDASWSQPITVDTGTFNSMSISITDNRIYLLSWEYGTDAYGPATMFSSADGGQSWASADVLGGNARDGFPNLCAYSVGDGQDVILVAAGPGKVYKSTDNGLSFSYLSTLPLGTANYWRYMAIGTNASLKGGPVDSDVYVFGARIMGSYWSGQLYLSMTKSSNGGLNWSEPVTICPFLSYHAEITIDGDVLYVVFNSLVQDSGYASVYAIKSSDWGASWSTPVMIYHRTFSDGGASPCSLQNIGGGRALLTMYDARAIFSDNKGVWGVLDLDNLTYVPSGFVQGGQWQMDLGFAGKIMPDGRMAVGWLYRIPSTSSVEIRFAYGVWQTWTPRVTVASGLYAEADLYVGQNYEYILTWDYPSGPVYLERSADQGATWTSKDVFGVSIYGAWPAMCGYANGADDELIVVGGDYVAISKDNGNTFQRLADLPSYGWRGMEVGTRASWLGVAPDNEIFIAGITGSPCIGFVKSSDGGQSWGPVTYPCGVSSVSYWPAMVSDGYRLCLVYSVLKGSTWGTEDFDLHVMYSNDWGMTWSADKMLVDAPTGEHCVAFQMQYAGGHRAILAFSDDTYGPDNALRTSCVNYGYLDMETLTYTRVGTYSDGGWMGYGVGGVLQPDGRFSLAFVQNVGSISNLYYTSTYDSGLKSSAFVAQGKLSVRIDPALPGMISVDGRDVMRWQVDDLWLDAGNHTVCFSGLVGYEAPEPCIVHIAEYETTYLNCSYDQLAGLSVATNSPLETIYIDGVPRNDGWLWTYLPAGNHTITFGAVLNATPHEPIELSLVAGERIDIVAEPTQTPGAPGPDNTALGTLRVTTNPAMPAPIFVDGVVMNHWGLDWVDIAPGNHSVTFGDIPGYTTPEAVSILIVAGQTTTVNGNFVRCSGLRVITSPPVAAEIFVNGQLMAKWGLWTEVPAWGQYTITCRLPSLAMVSWSFTADPSLDYQFAAIF